MLASVKDPAVALLKCSLNISDVHSFSSESEWLGFVRLDTSHISSPPPSEHVLLEWDCCRPVCLSVSIRCAHSVSSTELTGFHPNISRIPTFSIHPSLSPALARRYLLLIQNVRLKGTENPVSLSRLVK